jgi:hypothetical protein
MTVTLPNRIVYRAIETTPRRDVVVRKSILSPGDIFCLLAPLLQFVRIQFVGVLQATDLVLLAALPIAVIRHSGRLRQKPVPTILTLGIFWLGSQMATDFVRHSAPEDYLRGWSKIVLILVSFTVLWTVVCVSRRRFILYGIGAAIGMVLTLYIQPTDQMLESPWKFGLSGPITTLVVIGVALCAKHRYTGIVIPMTVLAVIHAFGNTRGLAMMCFVTTIYSLFQMSAIKNEGLLDGRRFVLLAGLVAVGMWGFMALYSHYALQGVFGEYARQKLEAQSGEGGLLLGGRSEILASGQAILDSPLLGHGSWARDPTYAAILAANRRELGYKSFEGGKLDDLIPAHSHIFGAWVDGGALGAVFWLFVLVYAIRSLMKVSGWEPLLPLFAFAGFSLVWDILFSPISPDRRFVTPYFIAAMVLLQAFRTSPSTAEWKI